MAQPRLAAVVREHIGEAVHKGARALIDTKGFARDRAGSTYVAPRPVSLTPVQASPGSR